MRDRWRTDDVHKRRGIVVSSYRHTVPSTGLACLVAAWVINGTLLAASGTRFHTDTDTEQYVAAHACSEMLMHGVICFHMQPQAVYTPTDCVLLSQNDKFLEAVGLAEWM